MQELLTERLLLRQWRQADIEPYADFFADAEMAKYVGGHTSRDLAWRMMAAVAGHWSLRGYGCWAVEEKEARKFVGCVGLWFPEGWPELELGYWVVREMQGKGYAYEAALKAREMAFGVLEADTLVSYIHPENKPSIRLAERLGGRYDSTIELLKFGPHLVYRYPKTPA